MIRVLPDVVQNKIAAGEVVERPASAVKELVENAIDAGATKINIEIEEGGMRTIKVADDGCGMSKDDLILSIERHATSKIYDVEDIFSITTMGFRGEALPSIGSVSRLTISTCLEGQDVGESLRVVGGKIEGVIPAPPRKGTIIEVNDLFFNTPARRKFMKSASAEMGAINETITRIALANHRVAFSVKGNGKRSMELAAQDRLQDRITDLFGKSIELLPVDYTTSNGELRITGFCGKPPESRGNSRFIYTLLNNRWIKHPGINRGILDAYQGNLPPRRYPFAVLCFVIDPAKVDINAHPTKEVVRFENDSLFVGGCRKAIEKALRGGDFPEEVERARREIDREKLTNSLRGGVESYVFGSEGNRTPINTRDFRDDNSRGRFTGNVVSYKTRETKGFEAGSSNFARSASTNYGYNNFEDYKSNPKSQNADRVSENVSPSQGRLDIESMPQMRFVGQVGGKYLIVEKEDGVVFIDQHALHERWNYNRLINKESTIDSQKMLIPIEIELSAVEEAVIVESVVVLKEAGFEMKLEGSTLVITAHPDIVRPHNIERVVRDILSDIDASPIEEYRERINASLACRASVLFGTNLSEELCIDLVKKLDSGALFTCPHGRPTKITFTWKELAYKFDR